MWHVAAPRQFSVSNSRNRLVCLSSEFCARLEDRQKIKADLVFLGEGCAFIALLFNHTVLWTHGGEYEVLRMPIGALYRPSVAF